MEEEVFEDDETNTRFSSRTVTRILQQAVSYTHLDVYKRQGRSGCPTG